jgi:hypothetical protein
MIFGAFFSSSSTSRLNSGMWTPISSGYGSVLLPDLSQKTVATVAQPIRPNTTVDRFSFTSGPRPSTTRVT